MNDSRAFLTEQDKQSVKAAIDAAEKRTAAEIVCVVSTESGRYDRAESLVGLLGSLIGLAAVNSVILFATSGESWPDGPWAGPGWQAAAVVCGFAMGTILSSYWHGLRRLFVGEADMNDEVDRAAAWAFRARGLDATKDRGGVLLYLSLFERRLSVLTDAGATAAAGEGFAEALRDVAQREMRTGNRAAALIKTVETAAERLATKLPRDEFDVDELRNDVIIIHPRP